MQLTPNVIQSIVSFELLYNDLGFSANMDFYKMFYTIKKYASDKGWLYFSPQTGVSKLTDDAPTSIKNWKTRFIFMPNAYFPKGF